MSWIKVEPFTFKKIIFFVLCCITPFVFNNTLMADDGATIIGHYYIAKDDTKTTYKEKTKWLVSNPAEWSKFLVNLKSLPKDTVKNNPMRLHQSEIIHFNVTNPDQKSGHDVFISNSGIQHFGRIPVDRYYEPHPDFSKFLENELTANLSSTYATQNKTDINQSGIVVVYRVSSKLGNPSWVIKPSDKERFEIYKKFLNSFVNASTNNDTNTESADKQDDSMKFADTQYDSTGTFVLYLNYPDAQNKFIVVGKNMAIRGTKIRQESAYYLDTDGYFSIFKKMDRS